MTGSPPSSRRGGRAARSSVEVPDMTPEEHRRRGDAATAMFRADSARGDRQGPAVTPPNAMPEFAEQNLFEMFVANDRQPFWLRRTTWGNTCAKVVEVGQFKGPPPYWMATLKVFARHLRSSTGS